MVQVPFNPDARQEVAQELLNQAHDWDAQKRAALERFLTRPRQLPPDKLVQWQPSQSAGTTSTPFSNFYNILKNPPGAGARQSDQAGPGPVRHGGQPAGQRYNPYGRPTSRPSTSLFNRYNGR